MPLNLYRRHRQECEAGHPEESRSGEFEERSKKWKRCGCEIYASGTLAGKFKRRTTKRNTWEDAKTVVESWEVAGSWDTEAPAVVEAPQPERGVTLDRAIKAYMAEHEQHSAAATVRKYRLILARLTKWAAHKGYVYLQQWGPIDIRECRQAWTSPFCFI